MRNIWILKPGSSSRGRGITLYNTLFDILHHMQDADSGWVAQKYIENPMIINERKFDIRIWVIVTDWNPLTIWCWEKPYFRFTAGDYDADQLDRATHLTNNAVT